MQLGMIGLGRMGGNIVRRLMKHGHSAVVYDKDPKAVAALAAGGALGAGTLEDFVSKLERPRTAWVMLPAGKITEATVDVLAKLMQAGDVIIDGGNAFWQDDVRRGKALKERGIHYLDVGTSGGVWGIERCKRRTKAALEMHAKRTPAALGEHVEIAARLRRLDDAEACLLARHRQILGIVGRDLQEHAAVGSALVGLAGRVQEARPETDAGRDLLAVAQQRADPR